MEIIQLTQQLKRYFKSLEQWNVIVLDEDVVEIMSLVNIYGKRTIIKRYKFMFLFKSKPKYFKRGTRFLSIAQICHFDHLLSNLLKEAILEIEARFESIMIDQMIIYLNARIFPDNKQEIEELDLTINELTRQENKKIFQRLFNKHDAIVKREIFKFLKYLANNKDTIDTDKSIIDLFYLFKNNSKQNVKKVEKIESILYTIIKKDQSNKHLSLTESLLSLSLDLDRFNTLYKEYSFRCVIKKLAKGSTIKKIGDQCIDEIWTNWSLGTKIEIFDCLNEDVKTNIINEFFSTTDTKMSGDKKSSVFTEILCVLRDIRNKSCHNDCVFNYEVENNGENVKILSFLKCNNIKRGELPTNLNLSDIIECIILFTSNNSRQKQTLKLKILEALEEINFEILPEELQTFLKTQLNLSSLCNTNKNE